jgi:hypothetical protein
MKEVQSEIITDNETSANTSLENMSIFKYAEAIKTNNTLDVL